MLIRVLEGNEQYVPIAQQAAGFLSEMLSKSTTLKDGQGNCGQIAGIVHGCARAAGHKARLLGGKVYKRDGSLDFGDGGHYWVELPDGTVIDGTGTDTIRVHRPDQTGERFIPILKWNGRRPSMKGAKTLLSLSKAIQTLIEDGALD